MKRRAKGFSLVELLVVVAILLTIAAIAIPYVLRAGQRALEVSAVGRVRALRSAQETHRITNQQYAHRWEQMPEMGFPDDVEDGGEPAGESVLVRSNYIFKLRRPAPDVWTAVAEPVRDRTNSTFFYTDQSGVLRYKIGEPAGPESPVYTDDNSSSSDPEKGN